MSGGAWGALSLRTPPDRAGKLGKSEGERSSADDCASAPAEGGGGRGKSTRRARRPGFGLLDSVQRERAGEQLVDSVARGSGGPE